MFPVEFIVELAVDLELDLQRSVITEVLIVVATRWIRIFVFLFLLKRTKR